DGAEEADGQRPGADADLDDQRPGADVAPGEDRAEVLGIDRLGAPRQRRNQLRVGRPQEQQALAVRRLDRAAFGESDQAVARERGPAEGHVPPAAEDAEIRALLSVDEDDRLAVAETRAVLGHNHAGRRAHAGAALSVVGRAAPRAAARVWTARIMPQKAHSSPQDGMPQPAHSRAASRSSATANAGCPVRRNSFTKACFVPGLATSSRFRTSL